MLLGWVESHTERNVYTVHVPDGTVVGEIQFGSLSVGAARELLGQAGVTATHAQSYRPPATPIDRSWVMPAGGGGSLTTVFSDAPSVGLREKELDDMLRREIAAAGGHL